MEEAGRRERKYTQFFFLLPLNQKFIKMMGKCFAFHAGKVGLFFALLLLVWLRVRRLVVSGKCLPESETRERENWKPPNASIGSDGKVNHQHWVLRSDFMLSNINFTAQENKFLEGKSLSVKLAIERGEEKFFLFFRGKTIFTNFIWKFLFCRENNFLCSFSSFSLTGFIWYFQETFHNSKTY